MKVENFLLNNIIKKEPQDLFKEGSILKGKILEALDDIIVIDIKGEGVLRATSDVDVKSLVGQEISFLVKSKGNAEIKLQPLITEKLESNFELEENKSVLKFLNNFNIKETKLSINLVENLMKNNVHINEKSLVDGIKVLEKIMELVYLEDGDKVIAFDHKNIDNESNMEKGSFLEKENLDVDLLNKNIDVQKIDIRKLLVVEKNAFPGNDDLSQMVQETLGYGENTNGEVFNKIISIFIKQEIEMSLNNIKNMRRIMKEPTEYVKETIKDFNKINDLLNKFEGNTNGKSLKNFPVNFTITKQEIEKESYNIKKLQEIIEKSEMKSILDNNSKKEINEIENKIDFLKTIDQDLSFTFLPIYYSEKDLDGVLSLLKQNTNKKTKDGKINVFIDLNTNSLGNIKIMCQADRGVLSVKINVQRKDLKFFQSTEEKLIHQLKLTGYTINKIDFVVEEDIDIIDTMITNPNPKYFLDIRV